MKSRTISISLIDMAKRLEGLPRHTSMHAAGVVISQKDVSEYVPLSRASGRVYCHSVYHDNTGRAGTSENGFPGSSYPDCYQNAVIHGGRTTGKASGYAKIDYNDKRYWILSEQDVLTVCFSWRSAGMKSFMKELKPQSLEDVIAGISLYRPGPMDFIPNISGEKTVRIPSVMTAPAGADPEANLWLYRIPGAGYADRP